VILFLEFSLRLVLTWTCPVLQKCRVDYDSDAKDMERMLMELVGGLRPSSREEYRKVASPTASREEKPSDRPEHADMVGSLTPLEVGVPTELAPHGSIFELTPPTETAMSLPLEPSVETRLDRYPPLCGNIPEPPVQSSEWRCSCGGETARWLLVTVV